MDTFLKILLSMIIAEVFILLISFCLNNIVVTGIIVFILFFIGCIYCIYLILSMLFE